MAFFREKTSYQGRVRLNRRSSQLIRELERAQKLLPEELRASAGDSKALELTHADQVSGSRGPGRRPG